MSKNKKQDDLKWLEEEDPFGLDEDIQTITFECLDCGEKDDVPDFVVDEFGFDLEKNESVEVLCPFCHGTMRQAKDVPSQ